MNNDRQPPRQRQAPADQPATIRDQLLQAHSKIEVLADDYQGEALKKIIELGTVILARLDRIEQFVGLPPWAPPTPPPADPPAEPAPPDPPLDPPPPVQ